MPWITGEYLNRKWQIGAKQSRFAEAGRFYIPLEKFPGALCDPCGYVLFDMEDEHAKCPQLRHPKPGVKTPRLNVEKPGISRILGYVKVE